jgi:NitT/TauT family transport system substrate-binding protein
MDPACPQLVAVQGGQWHQAAFEENAAGAGALPKVRHQAILGLRWLLFCLLLLAPGCTERLSPPMRIGMNVWPGYEPLFLARSQGRLEGRDFHLVEFSDASEVSRAFRSGTLEAACLTLDEVFYTMQDGMDPVILLVMDYSQGADVVLARPGIKSLAELKGKRIAVEVTAVAAYMLTRALQQAGLARQDIIPVYLPIEKHFPAYRDGLVDAVVTFEPVRTKLLALGAVDLFNSAAIPGEVVDVLVARRDYLEAQPGRAAALRQAWFAALEQMRCSPQEAARIMAPREQMSAEEFAAALQGIHLPDEDESRRLLSGGHPGLLAAAERLQAVMRQSGLLRREIRLQPLFSNPAEGGKAP